MVLVHMWNASPRHTIDTELRNYRTAEYFTQHECSIGNMDDYQSTFPVYDIILALECIE
jgi:hypothetical protein